MGVRASVVLQVFLWQGLLLGLGGAALGTAGGALVGQLLEQVVPFSIVVDLPTAATATGISLTTGLLAAAWARPDGRPHGSGRGDPRGRVSPPAPVLVELRGVRQGLRRGGRPGTGAPRHRPGRSRGGDGVAGRPLGIGQEHAAQPGGAAGPGHRGHPAHPRPGRGAARRRRADAPARRDPRLRVPVPPPAPGPVGGGERDAPGGVAAGQAPSTTARPRRGAAELRGARGAGRPQGARAVGGHGSAGSPSPGP